MSTDIYVDHLPVDVSAEEIRELFFAYGIVEHVNLMKNGDTGRLRGFGFVAMRSGANKAIAALHDRELGGSRLHVGTLRDIVAKCAAIGFAPSQAIEVA